ncbi:MAG: rhodanese-like domain-containing protein [Pseudomonadota bacterium]|nr:rhodanese-like domain-containing protein [Pseudomonadota bacterium]
MYGFDELEVSELQGLLQAAERGIDLIDVRTPAEVARGAIPGARNIPLHLLPVRERELDAAQRVILYCQTGARSAQACAFLAARGRRNVYNLRGGIRAWLHSGQPAAAVETAESQQDSL